MQARRPRLVDDPPQRRIHSHGEWQLGHLGVEHDVNAHDRGRLDPPPARGLGGELGRHERRGRPGGHREDYRRRSDRVRVLGAEHQLSRPARLLLARAVAEPHRISAIRYPFDRGDVDPEPHLRAEPGEQLGRRTTVQVSQRHRRDADVSLVPMAEQARVDQASRGAEVGLLGGRIEDRHQERVPEPGAGPAPLPVPVEPVADCRQVLARVGQVGKPHRGRGRDHGHALGQRQRPVAGQRPRQVQRGGPAAAPQAHRPVLGERRQVEPLLERRQPVGTEPGQQVSVGGEAAQKGMLAVVDGESATAERPGRPAQPGPGLEYRYRQAGLGQRERRADPS